MTKEKIKHFKEEKHWDYLANYDMWKNYDFDPELEHITIRNDENEYERFIDYFMHNVYYTNYTYLVYDDLKKYNNLSISYEEWFKDSIFSKSEGLEWWLEKSKNGNFNNYTNYIWGYIYEYANDSYIEKYINEDDENKKIDEEYARIKNESEWDTLVKYVLDDTSYKTYTIKKWDCIKEWKETNLTYEEWFKNSIFVGSEGVTIFLDEINKNHHLADYLIKYRMKK